MENKTPEERLTELMQHCCGCPFFSYEDRGNEGMFLCALLKDECYEDCNRGGDIPCEECEDADLLAIATYDKDGKIIELEMVSDYPENCPREQYKVPDWIFGEDYAHHHMDMGSWILRETFLEDKSFYYIAFSKDGSWVIPIDHFSIDLDR